MRLQTLATSLRQLSETNDIKILRGQTHDVFDTLWKSGHMTRAQAYAWLAYRMGMPKEQAHIAKFNAQQCHYVIQAAKNFLPNLYA